MINKADKDVIGNLPINDVFRPISHRDVVYLLNMHPFIQIINPNGYFEGDLTPKVVDSLTGWTIIRYGNDIICSSLGKFVFDGGNDHLFMKSVLGERDSGDNGETAMTPTGKGTIIKQTHDVSVEIINMALNSKWNGVELVDGSPLIKQILWLLCEEKGLNLKGYEPDEELKTKTKQEQRRKKLAAEQQEETITIRPT